MNKTVTPHLFGLDNSNRDFSQKDVWGKNQFNSSFPAALCCYLASKEISANYLMINNGKWECSEISISDLFGMPANHQDIFFAFETVHMPFQKYVIGSLPRTDLVVQNKVTGHCLTGLEIKLTALPDNTTCMLHDDKYGSEIVIRPDSIVYLSCSLAEQFSEILNDLIIKPKNINNIDWSDAKQILPILSDIQTTLINIYTQTYQQQAFLIQPVWKTQGKTPRLANNCLDVFVWSDVAFVYFIEKIAHWSELSITRSTRTAIWLYKMLLEISEKGHFNHNIIIDKYSYNTKNDKAFSSTGAITNHFMKSKRLTNPIIHKDEIKNIILGGGQELLSPERRFDAIIYNSPELFL